MAKTQTPRDLLRSSLLASKEPPFTVVEYEGQKVALKRPTAGQRGDIYHRATTISSSGEVRVDINKLQLAAILVTAHTVTEDGKPGERIFEDGDAQALMEQPAGMGVIDVLGPEATKALGGKDGVEEAKKA